MPIPLNRLVFEPGVALVATTRMHEAGFLEALSISGIEDAAEMPNSPLARLTARVLRDEANGDDIAEFAGRQCYRSWERGRPQDEYIANVIEECHGSIFRHCNLVFQITGVSRALTHELVRHGIGTAPSQESQRYVDAKDIRFVIPPITANQLAGKSDLEIESDPELTFFRKSCNRSLADYIEYQARLNERLAALKDAGDFKGATSYKKRANEAARAVLPNATETRLLFTMNLQSIRHILSLRGSEFADLEIRRLVAAMLDHARDYAPAFFRDVMKEIGSDGLEVINAKNGKL